ncbi:hypothetical protein ABIC83_005371 [Roseateles asaccharophilus]|uniref:Uncharacterized protein n=1 Tax=Roseateles asaccharophilus TaxID=582607 RepID=A0ABU2ABY1_9BURK|nr:hypothetical protein [Roseateles asaccharophilus]
MLHSRIKESVSHLRVTEHPDSIAKFVTDDKEIANRNPWRIGLVYGEGVR